MRPRDFQKRAVYRAEQSAFSGYYSNPNFESIDECREFLSKIMESDHWQDYNGYTDITIKDFKGRARALYHPSQRSMTLPAWARNSAVVLHEATHGLVGAVYGNTPPSHGIEFCKHYLCLVKELLGDNEYDQLRNAFDQRRVRYLDIEHENDWY